MPRPPPRPLCLPDLLSNPQARAEYIEAYPPSHGPSSSRPSSLNEDATYPFVPHSPTSTTDADSHRASGATLASVTSPVTPASTRTSLSVHNVPWNGDFSKRSSGLSSGLLSATSSTAGSSGEAKSWGMNLGNLGLGGGEAANKKPRASWSSAFANTKSWFGNSASNSAPTEVKETSTSAQKHSSQKEIKLSPSMIAASVSAPSISNRPVSSPYPSSSDPPLFSPTGSVETTRLPRVGTGLRYYTESNPAPSDTRIQIPDPIDPQDFDRPSALRPLSHPDVTSAPTFTASIKQLPGIPDVTVHATSPPNLYLTGLKDSSMLRSENAGPLSPPPTPPVPERESNVPHIKVSYGEDL